LSGAALNPTLYATAMSRLYRYCGFNLCRVMARALPDEPVPRDFKGILEYRMVEEAQLLRWCADSELELSEEKLRRAFVRGDRCVGAFERGKLVGYMLFAFQPAPDGDDVWVAFHRDLRYAYKGYLRPAYRGRRIGTELFRAGALVCPREDRSIEVTMIHTHNTRSLRAAHSAGWMSVGYAGYVKALGLFVPFRSPGARGYGFRFFEPANIPGTGAQARAT
jgi:GNAT superfamily N-acetyltransferase